MKSKKRILPLFLTVALTVVLMLAVTACSFTFGDEGTDAPGTTGYVVMSTAVEPQGNSKSFEDVIAELLPKAVEINATVSNGESRGSGVLIGKTYSDEAKTVQSGSIVVTNHHVIADSANISVKTYAGDAYEAKLVGSDPKSDVAVLEIKATGIEPAAWLDSDTIRVGMTAVAIGNALGEFGNTVTKGVVSAIGRAVNVEGNTMKLLQTDASINSGNSGGGLFSENGNLLGIVNAKVNNLTDSSGTELNVEGLGFAIPANTAKAIAEQLLNTASVSESGFGYVPGRYDVGLTLGNIKTSVFGASYIGVAEVDTDGCGYAAGLALYDQIVSVSAKGQTASTLDGMQSLLDADDYVIGDEITLSVKKNGSGAAKTIVVTISQYVYTV